MASARSLPPPITVADDCIGADLIAALRAHADAHGVPLRQLVRLHSASPHTWLRQVAEAQRPKPRTIQLVRQILDSPPPPPPSARAKRSHLRVVHIAPQAPEPAPPPPEPPTIAARVLTPAEKIRAEVFAQSAAAERRKREAQSHGAVNPLAAIGDQPVRIFAPRGEDYRRIVSGREPCRLCGTRADIGCRHQRPDRSPEIQGKL